MQEGRIVKVSGPLIVAENMADVKMFDVVKVGDNELIGEVIELRGDRASIQVYEETSGLGVGDKVVSTGYPLSVELAPGLIEGIFDGIQRPLEKIVEHYGDRITRGLKINNLDREKKWKFIPKKKVGDEVVAGDVLGVVNETSIVEHRILVPDGVSGRITDIKSGEFTITETIAKVGDAEICMLTRWPVRKARPYKEKQTPDMPMVTGQRVIDTLFPIAKGGGAAVGECLRHGDPAGDGPPLPDPVRHRQGSGLRVPGHLRRGPLHAELPGPEPGRPPAGNPGGGPGAPLPLPGKGPLLRSLLRQRHHPH